MTHFRHSCTYCRGACVRGNKQEWSKQHLQYVEQLHCYILKYFRSPWSNKYEPPIEDGAMPSARLRKLEVEANNAFDQYRDL